MPDFETVKSLNIVHGAPVEIDIDGSGRIIGYFDRNRTNDELFRLYSTGLDVEQNRDVSMNFFYANIAKITPLIRGSFAGRESYEKPIRREVCESSPDAFNSQGDETQCGLEIVGRAAYVGLASVPPGFEAMGAEPVIGDNTSRHHRLRPHEITDAQQQRLIEQWASLEEGE